MVQGRLAYIVARTPPVDGAKPGSVSVSRPSGSAAVYSGFTSMPSGGVRVRLSTSRPRRSLAASACQSSMLGGSPCVIAPGYEPVPAPPQCRAASAGPVEDLDPVHVAALAHHAGAHPVVVAEHVVVVDTRRPPRVVKRLDARGHADVLRGCAELGQAARVDGGATAGVLDDAGVGHVLGPPLRLVHGLLVARHRRL